MRFIDGLEKIFIGNFEKYCVVVANNFGEDFYPILVYICGFLLWSEIDQNTSIK